MKPLFDYMIEAQAPDPSKMTPVPQVYADTLLGVFWNKIRTVSEKRTMGWTNYHEISDPIKEYIKNNKHVPILTQFGTGKKLACSDMVRFISCVLSNIKATDAKEYSDIQKAMEDIFKEINLEALYIEVGDVGEIVDSYLDHTFAGVKFYSNETQKPFTGFSLQWRTGHIDIKL